VSALLVDDPRIVVHSHLTFSACNEAQAIVLDSRVIVSSRNVSDLRSASEMQTIVALAWSGTKRESQRIRAAGVDQIVSARIDRRSLLAALGLAGDKPRELRTHPRVAETLDHTGQNALACLTPCEKEVAQLVARGLSNKQIARCRGSTVSTVKAHVHNVLQKLGASRRVEVVLLFTGVKP
jgi:DNA-binding NarL/FixJ family response regulator